jgi:hypothetical protein
MALSDPKFVVARGVMELPGVSARTPAQDDVLIEALKGAFPDVAARQMLPAGLPTAIPYLALQSTASRLAISAVGSELETRFYGEFETDAARCLDYFTAKLIATLRGWAALDLEPSFLGVLVTINFPFDEAAPGPAEFIAAHHLRQEIEASSLQDAQARIAIRLEDTHFLSLQLSNYELRSYERPVFAGQRLLQVRPWEGEVDERGVELTIDINDKLALMTRDGNYTITEDELTRTMSLMRRAVELVPEQFVDRAAFNVSALTREEAEPT